MMKPILLVFLAVCLALCAPPGVGAGPVEAGEVQLQALMPPQATREEDSYLCTTITLPDEPMQLVGFEPQAHDSVVHHILLFGEWVWGRAWRWWWWEGVGQVW